LVPERPTAFGGLGISVQTDNDLIKIVSLIDGAPAAHGGIKPGDIITALDGRTIVGLALNEATNRMRGPPETTIVLTVKRPNVDGLIEIPLIRKIIRPQANNPQEWARIQMALGTALWKLGTRETETARLEEAVTTYRAALEGRRAIVCRSNGRGPRWL
jgi:carboxyl-terminal processing protease